MARNRPSPMALIQSYLNSGAGAESTALLEKFSHQPNASTDDSPASPDAVAPVTVVVPEPVITDVVVKQVQLEGKPAATVSPAPKKKTPAKPKEKRPAPAAHIGIHTGTASDTPSGTLSGIDADTDATNSTGIDTRMDAGLNRHGYPSEPVSTGTDTDVYTNKGAGMDAGALTGALSGIHNDMDTDISASAHIGMDVGSQTGTLLYAHIHPDAFFPFTPGQGKVLLYLIEAGGKTNRNIIEARTGVPLSSLAKTLRLLEKAGYIKRAEQKVYDHRERGFYYSTDRQMCSEFYERVTGTHIGTQNETHHGIHSGIGAGTQRRTHTGIVTGTQVGIHTSTHRPFSSKVLEEKGLTTSKPGLLSDPELRFWSGEGVTEKQVQNWMAEFELSEEEISLSLRYARFDILERGDVQNSANWLYKILTRNGFYPRPPNYRSLVEIKAEALKQQRERDQEARTQLEASTLDDEFTKFLQDPDSPLYQQLFEQASSFAKEQGGFALETELKELFKNGR